PERDRLTSYDRLVEWAIDAGVFSRETGDTVRAASRRSPKRRDAALDSALRLRAVLRRVLPAIAAGERDAAALTHFDAYVERALAQRAIVRETTRRGARRGSTHLDWGWRDPASLEAIEWAVVWSAATLVVSRDAPRLRVCGGDDCGWMFVDRS